MFEIYHSEYNPRNLTGTVGGGIGSSQLSGYLGELFYHIEVPPSGTDTASNQYRKVFIKNTYPNSSAYTRVWIDAVEHQGQISIAKSSGLSDFSSTPTGTPVGVSGWTSPTNYAEGINLGTIYSNTYTGIWIKQTLSGICVEDAYATFRLVVGGVVG